LNSSMPSTNPRTYTATPSRKVAFLGLGVMGYPMAAHLALAGHAVTVYNRSSAKAGAWCAEYAATPGPRSAATPREAASGADFVFCCVGNDDDLRSVALGADLGDGTRAADGAFDGMGSGTVFVDHTTASAMLRANSMLRRASVAFSSSTHRCPVARPARRTAC
jgi:3-hydroxyisobutyrate dehydrogenase